MAITQQNLYIPGFNVPSIATNIDYDRLGVDKSIISVDYSVSPAVVTVKKGSIIEANGDTYLVDNDEVFAMANAAHNYITFDGTTFSSAATIGTWSTIKQGYYNGTVRTLRHYVDQGGESNFISKDINTTSGSLYSAMYDHIKVGLTNDYVSSSTIETILPLNNVIHDQLDNFNITDYAFTPEKTGYYKIAILMQQIGGAADPIINVKVDGVTKFSFVMRNHYEGGPNTSNYGETELYISKAQQIKLYGINFIIYGANTFTLNKNIENTYITIDRLL